MIKLNFESSLRAPQTEVWRHASSMQGVNHELMPMLRMTHPPEATDLTSPLLKIGETAFISTLLLFGVLPIDRHHLMLEGVYEHGFDERSWSWTQKIWIHQRRVIADGSGTRVTDELEFEPRLFFAAPVLRSIIRGVFEHRHKRLREKFGA